MLLYPLVVDFSFRVWRSQRPGFGPGPGLVSVPSIDDSTYNRYPSVHLPSAICAIGETAYGDENGTTVVPLPGCTDSNMTSTSLRTGRVPSSAWWV